MNEHHQRNGEETHSKLPLSEPLLSPRACPDYCASTIALLTDFGLTDAYVGTMKGVIASINPHARVIDLCHDIAPQDIHAAGFLLASAFEYFPVGTIYVAVVDPTVGSGRPAICARAGGRYFIGPDNGVISIACYRAGRPRIYLLENEEYFLEQISRTFHGRDIFAPAAAHLAAGVPIDKMGPRVRSMKRIRIPRPLTASGPVVRGQVVHVDRFGNLITNVGWDDVRRTFPRTHRKNLVVSCGDHRIRGLSETYSDVSPGAALALFGSFDLMEIAVRDGNASAQLDIRRGGRIRIARGRQAV